MDFQSYLDFHKIRDVPGFRSTGHTYTCLYTQVTCMCIEINNAPVVLILSVLFLIFTKAVFDKKNWL